MNKQESRQKRKRQEACGQPQIYIHADDFGMTRETTLRIEDCLEHGCLNSVSLLPNGCLREAASWIQKTGVRCSIHINLVEGKALSQAEDLPLLVRADGYMRHSFPGIFLLSLSPARKKLERQLYQEIRAQLLKAAAELPVGQTFGVDSHQHVHMIPLVFRTMLRVIRDENLLVTELRIPVEPIGMYLRIPKIRRTLAPINLLKAMILNFLWIFIRKEFENSGLERCIFCGILFSGKMDETRLRRVFPYFYRRAGREKRNLEFSFHPGYIERGEPFIDSRKYSFQKFYLSPDRKLENQAMHSGNFYKKYLAI